MEGGHCKHASIEELPTLGLYVPAAHLTHAEAALAPWVEEYVPGRHALQVVLPGALHVPRGQHDADPGALKTLPGGQQTEHSVLPSWLVYVFWGQVMQKAWPMLGWYEPSGHCKHMVMDA